MNGEVLGWMNGRLRVDAGHEVSVYAHGLHGAGLHNVVQGHIRSLQGKIDGNMHKQTQGTMKTYAFRFMIHAFSMEIQLHARCFDTNVHWTKRLCVCVCVWCLKTAGPQSDFKQEIPANVGGVYPDKEPLIQLNYKHNSSSACMCEHTI